MTELKPCPFCGNSAKLKSEKSGFYTGYYVECTSSLCMVRTSSWGVRDTAIFKWNYRV